MVYLVHSQVSYKRQGRKTFLKQFELSKSKEMRIIDELKQIEMERTICDV